jgi:hypothetical protein
MAWPRLHRRSWPAVSIPEVARPAHPGCGVLRVGARPPLRRAPGVWRRSRVTLRTTPNAL